VFQYLCVTFLRASKINYYWFSLSVLKISSDPQDKPPLYRKMSFSGVICNGQKLFSTWDSSSISNRIYINLAHVVSRQTVVAEVPFRSQGSPCGICGGQSGTGTGASPSASVFALLLSIHQCPILIWLLSDGRKTAQSLGNFQRNLSFGEIKERGHINATVPFWFAFQGLIVRYIKSEYLLET